MRRITCINENWSFTGPDKKEKQISIPHTWNGLDGQDGGNDYWRGSCVYRKYFRMPDWDPEKEAVFLEFRGANASADVVVNGQLCLQHDGGYSTFRVEISRFLLEENELEVTVDNSVGDRVYPQKADFTFYGGIYRDVYLIIVNKYHFDLEHWGSPGVMITSEVLESSDKERAGDTKKRLSAREREKTARISVKSWHNALQVPDCRVLVKILDREGNIVATGTGDKAEMLIQDVHLWDGVKEPYLYTAVLQLQIKDETVDEISSRFGVRSFCVDPKKGFFLNGRSYPLHGVCRHQDRLEIGNALSREHHREDMEMIREIGANALRLAHYQHDQYFYDLCDEYGIVVWAEITYISSHMPGGRENTVSQMKELILQNFNHPSIVTWGISNEITIDTKDKKDMLENHRLLNNLCHEMDPTRMTSLACYAVCSPFNKVAHITDLVSWNLYLGWYVPGLFLNDWWINFFHFCYPNRPLGFAEYGCEAMPNLHSSKPRRGDHTEEYQVIYHHFMLECFKRHPYMWANYVWNMFDFAADARNQGGEPGMNHKGLVTFDRKVKKDSFYLYKAYWSDEPFVHIAGSRYVDRPEEVTEVKVFSNLSKVTLYNNDGLVSEKIGEHVFCFQVKLEAENRLRAVAGKCEDVAFIRKVDKPNPTYKLSVKSSNSANWV